MSDILEWDEEFSKSIGGYAEGAIVLFRDQLWRSKRDDNLDVPNIDSWASL